MCERARSFSTAAGRGQRGARTGGKGRSPLEATRSIWSISSAQVVSFRRVVHPVLSEEAGVATLQYGADLLQPLPLSRPRSGRTVLQQDQAMSPRRDPVRQAHDQLSSNSPASVSGCVFTRPRPRGLVRVGEGIRPTRSHAAKQPKLRGGSVKNGPPLPMIITLFLKALGKAVHQHDGPASKGCPSFGNDRQAIKTSKMYFDRFFQIRLEIIE